MTLIASDGLEYADFTQRLLGNLLENRRNRTVRLRRHVGYSEKANRAYWEAYDRCIGCGLSESAALDHAFDASYGIDVASRPPSRAGVTNPVPQAPSTLHTAN